MRGVGNLSIQQILSNISKQNAFHSWTATANGKASNGCRLVSKIHGIFVGNSCNSIVLFVIVIIIAHQCLKKLVDSKNAALEKCPKCLHLSNRTFFCQTLPHGAYAIKQKNPPIFGRHAVRCVSLPKSGDFSSKLVHPARLERAAPGLGGSCSIQLSYGCMWRKPSVFNGFRKFIRYDFMSFFFWSVSRFFRSPSLL